MSAALKPINAVPAHARRMRPEATDARVTSLLDMQARGLKSLITAECNTANARGDAEYRRWARRAGRYHRFVYACNWTARVLLDRRAS